MRIWNDNHDTSACLDKNTGKFYPWSNEQSRGKGAVSVINFDFHQKSNLERHRACWDDVIQVSLFIWRRYITRCLSLYQ